jgi:hypothetical protein
VDYSAEHIEALCGAAARACLSGVTTVHLGLDALEVVVRDERLVASLGLDPVFALAAHERPVALFDGAEVQPVPVQAAGVTGVSRITRIVVFDHLRAVLRALSTWTGGAGLRGG